MSSFTAVVRIISFLLLKSVIKIYKAVAAFLSLNKCSHELGMKVLSSQQENIFLLLSEPS